MHDNFVDLLSDAGLASAEYAAVLSAANESIGSLSALVRGLHARRRHERMEQNLGIVVTPEAMSYLASRHALVAAALA